MDQAEIKLIEKLLNGLVEAAQKGDKCNERLSILGLAVIGAPALNRITYRLEAALRELDACATAALGKAIIGIWETNDDFAGLMNKEKVRLLLSRCPRMPQPIKKTLSRLRDALVPKPAAHASEKFLRGPRANYLGISSAAKRQKNALRLPPNLN